MSSDSGSGEEHPLSPAAMHKLKVFGISAVVVIAMLMAWGFYSRIHAQNALKTQTDKAATTVVTITHPSATGASEELVLPGNVQAFTEAPIYARTSGYLKRWYADIGKRVSANELLAEVETPEVDAQWRQAKADLATAEANYNLSKTTAERWQSLLASGVVAKQDVDDKVGDAQAKQAQVESARENLSRLEQLESFKRIVAPFDGIITYRGTDIGALINSGNNSGEALFRIAAIDKLRIYIQVPQRNAADMQPGLTARLHFTDHPNKTYIATIASTAKAIDPNTRTLLVELSVNNSDHELLPGAYAEVHLAARAKNDSMEVPSNVLLFRAAGMLVAIVDNHDQVVMKKVQIGRDYGKTVEILSGLDLQDRIILNPSDSLAEGAKVSIATDDDKNKS